jgi:hypothetical protein
MHGRCDKVTFFYLTTLLESHLKILGMSYYSQFDAICKFW